LVVSAAILLLFALAFKQERSIEVLTVTGPFVAESQGTKALRLDLQRKPPLWRILAGKSRIGEELRLLIDGTEMGPVTQGLQSIRRRGGGRYHQAGDTLVFSLPNEVINGPQARLAIVYTVGPPIVGVRVAVGMLLGGILIVGLGTLARRDGGFLAGLGALKASARSATRLGTAWFESRFHPYDPLLVLRLSRTLDAAHALLMASLWLVIGMALAYLLTVGFGVVSGFAVPTTAVFTLIPEVRSLARQERDFAYLILAFGWTGAILSWMANAHPALRLSQARRDRAIQRAWSRWVFVIAVATFSFSPSAQWAGVVRAGDYNAVAIAGRVPFSDAGGHYAGPLLQVMAGHYDSWVERRPVSAASRSLLALVSCYSATGTLLLQVLGLAVLAAVAARAVTRWRGVWAGITFFGLIYVLSRTFMSTFMSEPLGIGWALVGVPLLVAALRRSSIVSDASFLAVTCVSLLTRMGSLLTVPALALWMVWRAPHNARGFLRTAGAVGLTAVACAGLNESIRALYGSGAGVTASNFALHLCGLAHGGTWDLCAQIYGELATPHSEAESARLHLEKAKEMIRSNPQVLVGRLVQGEL
jgi:hypothetical protein